MPALHTVPPDAWPTLASFIHHHNRRPDGRVRCLHAEQGDTVASHEEELRNLPVDEAVFVVAGDPADPVGVVGAEVDPALHRAWLRGPLVAGEAALHGPLIDALLDALPEVRRFDAFPAPDEASVIAAYRRAGFVDCQQHHVMRVDGATFTDPTACAIAVGDGLPGDADLACIAALHDRLFPGSYLPGSTIAAGLDDHHRLFIARLGARPVGYAFVQDKPLEPEGYVDYIGVDDAARGQGVGRALLRAAVRWALFERHLPCVHLTVRKDRAPALRLYESLGFRTVAAGLHLQLLRAEPG